MTYTTYGTTTFPVEATETVKVADVITEDETLIIRLNDGRAIQLNLQLYSWLRWLLDATPEQRKRWEIVPSGGGVWWTELDEGIELQPLLDLRPLPQTGERVASELEVA